MAPVSPSCLWWEWNQEKHAPGLSEAGYHLVLPFGEGEGGGFRCPCQVARDHRCPLGEEELAKEELWMARAGLKATLWVFSQALPHSTLA